MSHALTEHGLWLVPSASQAVHYQSLINRLASSEPTQSPPTFQPHVTLLYPVPVNGNIDSVIETVRAVIADFHRHHPTNGPQLQLQLADATHGEQFYQSVLAPVLPIPEQLVTVRRLSMEKFGITEEKKPYFPHLSLFYGDLSKERRIEIAGDANSTAFPQDLEIDAIAVVELKGEAHEWKVITRVLFAETTTA